MTGSNIEIKDYLIKINITTPLWDGSPYDLFIGGVILNSKWILTTGQNLEKIKDDFSNVNFAELENSRTEKTPIKIEKIIKHENYNYFDNDIGLLELSEPIINASCSLKLASKRPDTDAVAYLYWWKESDDEKDLILTKTEANFKNNEKPEHKTRFHLHRIEKAWKNYIFGVPLMIEDEIVGIFCYTNKMMDAPDYMNDYIFMDIAEYKSWIEEKIN